MDVWDRQERKRESQRKRNDKTTGGLGIFFPLYVCVRERERGRDTELNKVNFESLRL